MYTWTVSLGPPLFRFLNMPLFAFVLLKLSNVICAPNIFVNILYQYYTVTCPENLSIAAKLWREIGAKTSRTSKCWERRLPKNGLAQLVVIDERFDIAKNKIHSDTLTPERFWGRSDCSTYSIIPELDEDQFFGPDPTHILELMSDPWPDSTRSKVSRVDTQSPDFLLIARYVPNVAKRSISVRRSIYWEPTDRPTTDRPRIWPISGKFQTAISSQGVVRSTSCLVLRWGFRGRRIEWR